MKLLEDRIRRDGVVLAGDVLKVDSFLNHQLDVPFLSHLGEELYRLFKGEGVNKILTIEASGIALACLTANFFSRLPFFRSNAYRAVSFLAWARSLKKCPSPGCWNEA